jgi:tRNA1(Val) A37 N6-methylase TrmN6
MHEAPEIHVLNKQVRLLQPHGGFRTSLDSVMLAAACPAQSGDHLLDLGCGVGGAGFCVLFRVPDTKLTGVDIQEDHIDLARQNIDLNSMSGRAEFIAGDIHGFRQPAFDHVICNPPYMESGTHTPSPTKAKATAHGHDETTLQDWLDAAFHNLKSGGSFTIIHRADQADKIISGLGKRFGAVEIIPLWPRRGVEAKRVIIRAVKDRKTPATLHAGLILHEANGDYTAETEKILRGGEGLFSRT